MRDIVPDETTVLAMPGETWRALIAGLISTGWSAQIGGGLDFSWASLTRDGMTIDMDFDIWRGGEVMFATKDAAHIRAALPAHILEEIGLGSVEIHSV